MTGNQELGIGRRSRIAVKLVKSVAVIAATAAFITAASATPENTGPLFCPTPESCVASGR